MVKITELPLGTNLYEQVQKKKRQTASKKTVSLVEDGDVQGAINSLTHKQKAFVEEFVKDLNASAAVLRAGYATKYPNRIGTQLLENPGIRLAIDALRNEANSKPGTITRDTVLKQIVKTMKDAESDGQHNTVLRAAELLARHLGMFIERQEISGPDGEAIRYEKVQEDAADFRSAIARLASRSGTE